MINKINDFSYKSFSHYTNQDECLFKQKNVIYGYNGKGKSSLAEGLEKEIKKDKDFDEANLRVFSRNYMTIKLINDSTKRIKGIKAVFGNKNIMNENEIEKLQKELIDIESIEKTIQDIKSKIDRTIKTTEDNIRGKIRIRHQDISNYQSIDELIATFESNYQKALKITTDDKLDNFNGDFDFEKAKSEIQSLPILDLSFNKEEIRDAVVIMDKVYSIEKIPSQELLDWIKKGIDLNKNQEHCLFCGSPISSIENIESKYKEYLSNEKQKDTRKISDLLESLSNVQQMLDNFLKNSDGYRMQKIDIDGELEKIRKEKDNLERFINLLKTKLFNFETKVDIPFELTFYDETIKTELNNIKQKKESAEAAISKEETKTNELIKGLIGKRVLNNKSLKIDVKEYKKTIEQLSSAKEKNRDINTTINHLKSSSSVFDSFAKYINQILLDLDIKFKLEIIKNDYRILPLNEDTEIDVNAISEGEKNLLSFLFFYYELFDDLNTLSFKSDLQYIIVDDPISSLDENNRTYLVTLLRNLIEQDSFQIFILTHDWTSFCNVLYGYKISKSLGAFEVKKDNKFHSYLTLAKPTISPYEHDFFELLEAAEKNNADMLDDCEIYHLPNCMRRVLETFLSFKSENCSPTNKNFYKIKEALYYDAKCSSKDETNLRTTLNLINANSHSPAKNSEDVYNSLKYLVKVISNADPVHYKVIKSKKGAYNRITQ